MSKNFFEVKNVDFKVGGKTKVMGNYLIISNETKIIINKREFLKKGMWIFINVFLFEYPSK